MLLLKLYEHGIIDSREIQELQNKLEDLSEYLLKKNTLVEEEVTSMGDEDYIPFSHRVKMATEIATAEGLAKGLAEGRAEMQSENDALRDEVKTLKAELEALKAAMA